MKSLINGILCLTLLSFAAACGKKSGGGGGGQPAYYNPYLAPGVAVTTQQAVTNVTNWFNGTVEGTKVQGLVKIQKYELLMNTYSNCKEKKFLGIPYQYCSTGSNSTNTGTLVPGSERNEYLQNDGVVINQKGNAELAAIFNGTAGTIVNAQESGSITQLDVLEGGANLVSYIIDRSVHSKLNPVQVLDHVDGKLINVRASCAFPTANNCFISQ